MKQNIQERIDQIRRMSAQDVSHGMRPAKNGQVRVDNLTRSVRNEQEAKSFINDLNAAVKKAKEDGK